MAGVLGCSSAHPDFDWASYGELDGTNERALEEARRYNLLRINEYRRQHGLEPLVLDETLNAFSQAATERLSRDRTPHRYFVEMAKECRCGLLAQNQGRRTGSNLHDIQTQIDDLLQAMIDEVEGGGHRENILSDRHRRLGAGLLTVDGEFFLTNDFAK